jgi:NAD(P)-dependent dehydrogenase (short-subunit alcohol dehydrogenase family)
MPLHFKLHPQNPSFLLDQSNMSTVLVVLGSGPGIALSTTSLFASKKFSKIALLSRNTLRLQEDKAAILASAGREITVSTFTQDIADSASFKKTLAEIEKMGEISCVFFNAARVATSDLMSYPEGEVVADFMVCRTLLTPTTPTTPKSYSTSQTQH